jgi:hypothetical protein
MGYVGLLLNDPYKIDRMMGECLIYFFRLLVMSYLVLVLGYTNQGVKGGMKT